jgi:outer membrane protein assembly factor BamB
MPALPAQDWPQWRGPSRDGHAPSFRAPGQWPAQLTLEWKAEVGGGYSSPVAAGGQACVFTRQREDEVVSCLDLKTGTVLWRAAYPAPFGKNQYAQRMESGPFSTPLLDGGRLYTLGVNAVLSSFDAATGALRWRHDFSKSVSTQKLFTGTAMSPLVTGGRVIVHVGDDRGGQIAAFDAGTGRKVWALEGDGPGYASPVLVSFGGTRQLVTMTDKSLAGVAAENGRLLWKFPFPDEWNENIVTPVAFENLLIFSGVRQGTVALTATGSEVKEAWRNKEAAMYMSSPVLAGGYLYGFSSRNKGQVVCLDPRTGEALWKTPGRGGQNASLIAAGGYLLLTGIEGELTVLRANPKAFEQVASYKVAQSATWPHPAVAGRQLLVKDAGSLSSWRLP